MTGRAVREEAVRRDERAVRREEQAVRAVRRPLASGFPGCGAVRPHMARCT